MPMKTLLILGCGYVGEKLAKACLAQGARVVGTTRCAQRQKELDTLGIQAVLVDSPDMLSEEILTGCDAILDSIPLERSGQKFRAGQVSWIPKLVHKLHQVKWIGYLSSTGVYGDAGGAWVDELWPCKPGSLRGKQRLIAEDAWLNSGLPVEVFRLAGIYGPGRNIISRLKAGQYKAVDWNPPHFSSRIHVDDIVAALLVAMNKPRVGRVMNLADDDPLPHIDYVSELARIIGASAPVKLSPEEGDIQLSAAALAFFSDNKRVSNRLLHQELLPELKYPSFREGFGSMNVEEFRLVAEQALNDLPENFRLAMENVVIVADDFPAAETMREMNVQSPFELLGLYEGRPVTEREVMSSGTLPDMIHLYRKPILAMCTETGEDINHCIRHVLVHEIGHYFGYSDVEMDAIEFPERAVT
jgi:predicted Zn-dependent protease with MMP-like domain